MDVFGGTAEHDPWNWIGYNRLALGEYAELQPLCDTRASGRLRWIGPAPTGIRDERARKSTIGAWRKRAVTDSVVPGEFVSDAVQPGDQGILRTITGVGEADEGGTVCGSAEVVACGMGGGDERAGV